MRIVDGASETLGQRFGRPGGDLDDREPLFGEAIELPPDGVELAVGGHELRPGAERQRRQQPRDELVRVLTERDIAVGIVQQATETLLHAGGLLRRAHPFVVDQLRRVEPRPLLRIERHVRPRLMRVAGQQQPFGDTKAGVVGSEIVDVVHGGYNCDRICQRSGKSGRPTVCCRYAAPAEPPVPLFAPIVRSTIFTCL